MPDHLHVLLQLPAEPVHSRRPIADIARPAANQDPQGALGTIIGNMKSFTTHQSWKLDLKGQLWQPRFYDHIVRRSEDGQKIALYILENPVRKGLVEDLQSWPWSGMPDPI
jgi:REP element-mobilizing transposase RayT